MLGCLENLGQVQLMEVTMSIRSKTGRAVYAKRRGARFAAAALTAIAVQVSPAVSDTPGRYTMSPTEGGMLKLDTATGIVAFCTRKPGAAAGDWTCAPVSDGEQALRRRIEGQEAEIAALKEQLRKADDLAGIGDPRNEPPAAPRKSLPDEKDVEQAFDYFERMMKVIRERMKRLEGGEKPGTPL